MDGSHIDAEGGAGTGQRLRAAALPVPLRAGPPPGWLRQFVLDDHSASAGGAHPLDLRPVVAVQPEDADVDLVGTTAVNDDVVGDVAHLVVEQTTAVRGHMH